MTGASYRGAASINYKNADLSELKYIKMIYTDKHGEVNEVKTETNYLSDNFISLYCKKVTKKPETKKEEQSAEENNEQDRPKSYFDYVNKLKEKEEQAQQELKEKKEEEREFIEEENKKYEVNCPQEVILKFIINDLLYLTKATLNGVEVKGTKVYFNLDAPGTLELQQKRKYYRIDLRRICLLVADNKEGGSRAYVARSINLSAGGVLINKLESMSSNEYISITPDDFEKFHIILVLEMDKVLKLHARYIRQEEGKYSYRYAFEFIDIPDQKVDFISKYVIRKQLEELRGDFESKNIVPNRL